MRLLRNGRRPQRSHFQALDDTVDAWLRRRPSIHFSTGSPRQPTTDCSGLGPGAHAARRRPRVGPPLGVCLGVESALTNGPIKLCFRARPENDAPRRAAPYGMRRPITSCSSGQRGIHGRDAAERLTIGAGVLRARGAGRGEPCLREDASCVRRAGAGPAAVGRGDRHEDATAACCRSSTRWDPRTRSSLMLSIEQQRRLKEP